MENTIKEKLFDETKMNPKINCYNGEFENLNIEVDYDGYVNITKLFQLNNESKNKLINWTSESKDTIDTISSNLKIKENDLFNIYKAKDECIDEIFVHCHLIPYMSKLFSTNISINESNIEKLECCIQKISYYLTKPHYIVLYKHDNRKLKYHVMPESCTTLKTQKYFYTYNHKKAKELLTVQYIPAVCNLLLNLKFNLEKKINIVYDPRFSEDFDFEIIDETYTEDDLLRDIQLMSERKYEN